MPPSLSRRYRHIFIITLDFPRGKEQTPVHLLQFGILKPFFLVKWKKCFLAQKFLGDFDLNIIYFGSVAIKREGELLGYLQVLTLNLLRN
jgi:hypothetical protein